MSSKTMEGTLTILSHGTSINYGYLYGTPCLAGLDEGNEAMRFRKPLGPVATLSTEKMETFSFSLWNRKSLDAWLKDEMPRR